MAKATSVPQKMLEFSGLHLKRMNQRFRDDDPEVAVFWATMVHSMHALASAMLADGQIHAEAFSELNRREQKALVILRKIGPFAMEGRQNPVLEAYGRFREEAEALGVV